MSESASIVVTPRGGGASWSPSWTRLYVRKSMDEICSYLEFETRPSERTRINAHDRVQVRYKNALIDRPVATGYVDDIDLEVSAKRNSLLVTGRSAARDIIDSSWSDEFSDKTLFFILRSFASKFGILDSRGSVNCWHIDDKNGADPTKTISSFAFENESPWQKLIQEADNQGFVITSSQDGGLYLWKVATSARKEGFLLKEGNGIEIKDKESGSEQFSKYVLNGADSSVTKTDASCRTKRICTINMTDKSMSAEALQRRLNTEILRRRNRRITVTTKSWGLSENQLRQMGSLEGKEVLWEINFLTPVKLANLGLDLNMLVSQVEYRADTKSMACDIGLSKPETYK
jgi:prophage tail gpP-like protein